MFGFSPFYLECRKQRECYLLFIHLRYWRHRNREDWIAACRLWLIRFTEEGNAIADERRTHTHTISLRKYWINIIQIAIICIITCLCISFKFIFEYNRMLLCILMVLPNGSRNVNHISQFTNFESSDSRRRRRPGDWLSEYHIILFSAIFTPVHYATDINLILQRFRRKKYLIMRTTNIYLTVFSSHFGALVDAPMLFNTCFQLMLNIIIPEAGEYLRPTLARRNKFVGNIFKWIARQIRRSKGKLLIATANISLQQRTTHIGSL